MVWYCTKHEMHSIDDICPECERTSPEARITTLEQELKRKGEYYYTRIKLMEERQDTLHQAIDAARAFLDKMGATVIQEHGNDVAVIYCYGNEYDLIVETINKVKI